MTELNENTLSVPCCPDVKTGQICNSLDFNYRLSRFVPVNDGQRTVEVEMIIHARIEVCRGGFNLGKLAYSTTLFPGEKVRLFTMDRRNSFTFDAESKLSYRHAQSYEEQFYLSSMSEFMSDLTIKDQGEASSKSNSSLNPRAQRAGHSNRFSSGLPPKHRATTAAPRPVISSGRSASMRNLPTANRSR